MENKIPPAADMLEILFEQRNKAYGAYILRREYPVNLRRGLMGSFALAVLFAITMQIGARNSSQVSEKPVFNIVPVELVKIEPIRPEEKPLKPNSQNNIARATNQDIVPLVVPDEVRIDKTVPTVEERLEAAAGVQDLPGDPAGTSSSFSGSPGPADGDRQNLQPAEPSIYSFESVENPAQFPGGERALRRFLEQHLVVPEEDAEGLVRVLVRFIVSADGTIGGFSLEQSGGAPYDQEVFRVLRKMPRWNPARQQQRNVSMYFMLPVVFQRH